MKKITDLRNGVKYEIVPKQKRTITLILRYINETKENRAFTDVRKRFLIDFPQSIFIEVSTSHRMAYYTFAVDEKNNLCYQPFLNVSQNGLVCMQHEAKLDAYINSFYNSNFSVCYDTYCSSINKYFYKSEYYSLFGCDRKRVNICHIDNDINLAQQNIEIFYKNFNNVKLIPVEKADLMFAGDFIS